MAKIKVALRVRPLSERELAGKYPVVVGVQENSAYVTDIRVPERPKADSRQRLRQFHFDHGFWLTGEGFAGATQQEVYGELGPPLENSILAGYNACLLAYGQSGTGKTHTMLGTKDDSGLIPRLCQGLWDKLKARETAKSSFRMEVSFIEIYREKIRDLLTPGNKALKLREHPRPHVQGLTRVEVSEQFGLLDLLWEGESRRASGATGSNRRSSRSHAIWTIYLSSTRQGSELVTTNQVHLVDLAGSEKAELITAKNLLAEGKDINRSLVSLGNVISSLAEKAQYIPYRDSTLTWLLKDSLGGNAATSIIITASPASCCHAQTLNSLRFAQRARLVENQPKINFINASVPGMFPSTPSYDIRNDIARLAAIIRSAQATGGILRGLMPRNGWNRLLAAIESWGHQNNEQQQPQRRKPSRAASVETPSTSTGSSTAKSLSSHQISQTNIKREREASFVGTQSATASPTKVPGTEVFIPYSNSIKCLTWRQQEISLLPKTPSSDSESETFLSPPTSPPMEMKVNHLKYLLPVHYPVCRNLDSESRIGERIHGNVQSENVETMQISPMEVLDMKHRPTVRERRATLVNPQDIPSELNESAKEQFYKLPIQVPVTCKGAERILPKFGFRIPEVSEFSKPLPVLSNHFASTDEDEETYECYPVENKNQEFSRFRLRRHTDDTTTVESSVEEEALYFSESSITSSPCSYESTKVQDNYFERRALPSKVKVVQNCHFDFSEVEDKLCEIKIEPHELEHHIAAAVSSSEAMAEDIVVEDRNESLVNPVTCVSSTKFRNHFVRELNQMQDIGNQIKNLRQMTQRFQVVKPYLDKIDRLSLQDHSQSNEKLDAEIEKCSGWDVNIEFKKVQERIASINNLLKYGASKSLESSPLSLTDTSILTSTSHSSVTSKNEASWSRRTSSTSCSGQSGFANPNSNCAGGIFRSKTENSTYGLSPKYFPSNACRIPNSGEPYSGEYNNASVENPITRRRRPILPKTSHYLKNSRMHNAQAKYALSSGTEQYPAEQHFFECGRERCHPREDPYDLQDYSPTGVDSYQNSRKQCGQDRLDFKESLDESSLANSSSLVMKRLCNMRKQMFNT